MNTQTSGAGAARSRWIVTAAVTGTVAAVALVLAVSAATGARPYEALGATDPGAAIRIGTPLLRVLADIAGTLCTGFLAYAACCTVATSVGGLSADGYSAVRGAARSAAVWCLTSLLLVPFSAGSVAGQSLPEVFTPRGLLGLLNALEPPKAWLISAGAALVLAISAARTLRRRPSAALLVLAVFALLPPLATGHSAANAGHDLATAAIMIHVPAAAIWIGVLAALLARGRRHRSHLPASGSEGAELAALTKRYRRLAGACWCVLALSGLVEAAVLVPPGALWNTTYGLLVVAIVVVTLALGVLGVVLRRRALRRVARPGSRTMAVLRLAALELTLLLVTIGMSATLTHLPPPAFVGRPVTPDQTLLGYNLGAPPTLLRFVTDWRVDVLFGPLAVLLAAGYVWGVLRLLRRGERWQPGRTAAWLAGCLVLLIATSSGVGRYANAMFSVHLASHMLVSMLVPVLLALGGPVTLARSALAPAAPGGLPGLREWLDGLVHSSLVRLLTHPLVALLLFAGSPFLLYFTGVFDAAVRFHWAHLAIDGYFLLVGYAFAWPVIGVDPAPRPLPNLARVGMLLAAMPADIVLGAAIMTTGRVIGNGPAGGNMYSALALPWVHDLLADQRLGGGIALAISEGTLLIAVAALLLRWSRTDDAGTADLPDYERMLLDARR